jgi:hypothetical protein
MFFLVKLPLGFEPKTFDIFETSKHLCITPKLLTDTEYGTHRDKIQIFGLISP